MATLGALLGALLWTLGIQAPAEPATPTVTSVEDTPSTSTTPAEDTVPSASTPAEEEAPPEPSDAWAAPPPPFEPASPEPEAHEPAAHEPAPPAPPPRPPARRIPNMHGDFVHHGGFLRGNAGFAMCTSDLCNEIVTGFGGAMSGGYRFPYVGVGATVMGGGGRNRNPSTIRGPLDQTGMSFLFVGALAQFVPIQHGRFSPSFDVALGYFRLMEWGRTDGRNAFALYSRMAVAVGGTLDIFVSRRVAIGPSFHYLFPFSGQQCNEIDINAQGHIIKSDDRQCSDYNYRENGFDGPERRSLRRDTTRAWLASVGVTVHLGDLRRR